MYKVKKIRVLKTKRISIDQALNPYMFSTQSIILEGQPCVENITWSPYPVSGLAKLTTRLDTAPRHLGWNGNLLHKIALVV